MEDNDRFEPVPEKEGVGAKLGKYFKNVFGGFIDSFRYNNMKLAAMLVAVPGLIIGFFLIAHANTINQIAFEFNGFGEFDGVYEEYKASFPGMPFDATGIVLFVMMLFGILNVFTSLNMSGKKNKGSVIVATVFTAIIVLCTVYYVYCVFYYKKITTTGDYVGTVTAKTPSGKYDLVINDTKVLATGEGYDKFESNYLVSIISIIICDILSIAGVVLGFINYDRTYEKVDR